MTGFDKQEESDQRRPARRKQVLMPGVITIPPGTKLHNCSILNLSDSGAQVTLQSGRELPSTFYLINIRDRCAYEARVAWRKQDKAGLVFSTQFNLTQIPDPGMRFLRRLWLEAAVQ